MCLVWSCVCRVELLQACLTKEMIIIVYVDDDGAARTWWPVRVVWYGQWRERASVTDSLSVVLDFQH